jgi:hypothetical protein
MRCVGRCVPARPDVADDLAFRDQLAIVQSVGVPIQVRVVVAEAFRRIELINGVSSRFAEKQFRDLAVFDGANRRIPRREDIYRLMPAWFAAARFRKTSLHLSNTGTIERQPERMSSQFRNRIVFAAI